jgi:hypothetical protein
MSRDSTLANASLNTELDGSRAIARCSHFLAARRSLVSIAALARSHRRAACRAFAESLVPLANQSNVPQCGQGASPGGRDGSMRTSLPQIGHLLSLPSGVRDEGCMLFAIGLRISTGELRNSTWALPGHSTHCTRWLRSTTFEDAIPCLGAATASGTGFHRWSRRRRHGVIAARHVTQLRVSCARVSRREAARLVCCAVAVR